MKIQEHGETIDTVRPLLSDLALPCSMASRWKRQACLIPPAM